MADDISSLNMQDGVTYVFNNKTIQNYDPNIKLPDHVIPGVLITKTGNNITLQPNTQVVTFHHFSHLAEAVISLVELNVDLANINLKNYEKFALPLNACLLTINMEILEWGEYVEKSILAIDATLAENLASNKENLLNGLMNWYFIYQNIIQSQSINPDNLLLALKANYITPEQQEYIDARINADKINIFNRNIQSFVNLEEANEQFITAFQKTITNKDINIAYNSMCLALVKQHKKMRLSPADLKQIKLFDKISETAGLFNKEKDNFKNIVVQTKQTDELCFDELMTIGLYSKGFFNELKIFYKKYQNKYATQDREVIDINADDFPENVNLANKPEVGRIELTETCNTQKKNKYEMSQNPKQWIKDVTFTSYLHVRAHQINRYARIYAEMMAMAEDLKLEENLTQNNAENKALKLIIEKYRDSIFNPQELTVKFTEHEIKSQRQLLARNIYLYKDVSMKVRSNTFIIEDNDTGEILISGDMKDGKYLIDIRHEEPNDNIILIFMTEIKKHQARFPEKVLPVFSNSYMKQSKRLNELSNLTGFNLSLN